MQLLFAGVKAKTYQAGQFLDPLLKIMSLEQMLLELIDLIEKNDKRISELVGFPPKNGK